MKSKPMKDSTGAKQKEKAKEKEPPPKDPSKKRVDV